MQITCGQPPAAIDRLAGATVGATGVRQNLKRGLRQRIVESVAAQPAFGQIDLLHAERRELVLHRDLSRQQRTESMTLAAQVDQRLEERHHSAALGIQRLAASDVRRERHPQFALAGKLCGVQFGVAAGQPDRVAVGQCRIGER